MRNSLSVSGLSELASEVRHSPEEGRASYGVKLSWQSGTRSTVETLPMGLGAHRVHRAFAWTIDEPRQLGGSNHGANPQEHLLSGLGGCILVAFAAGASVMGVQLATLDVEVDGELDLAGFLGEPEAEPQLKRIRYRILVAGDGSREQLEELHRQALRHSPNASTLARAVTLEGELVVLDPSATSEGGPGPPESKP